tara:strand:+ start:145268 stop:145462 length:195 start_codon:yes stop_codon:yes gene_type:complete
MNTLFTFVGAAMKDQRVMVTYLGRGLKSASETDKKHDIKRADRLIGYKKEELVLDRACQRKSIV